MPKIKIYKNWAFSVRDIKAKVLCIRILKLFKVWLKKLLKNWKQERKIMGIILFDHKWHLNKLWFLDEQIVILQNYNFHKIVGEYRKWDLEVNVKNTHIYVVRRTQTRLKQCKSDRNTRAEESTCVESKKSYETY